jgi:hypothetical protein
VKLTIAVGMLFAALLVGCGTTEFKAFEGKGNVIDGQGGTKVVVDSMEIWDNGEPPRKFKVLGVIEDERSGGVITMSGLRSDMVKKAREVGGDAIIQLNSQSRITGYHTSTVAPVAAYGNSTPTNNSSSTTPIRRNMAKYAVIKYIE